MASEDHMHKVRETSGGFSLDPSALDTPPFRYYDSGFPNVPPDEVRISPFLLGSLDGDCSTSFSLGEGVSTILSLPGQQYGCPWPPPIGEKDLIPPFQTYRKMDVTKQPLPWLGRFPGPPPLGHYVSRFPPDSSFLPPLFLT